MVISVLLVADENSPRQVKDYKIDCIADYTNKKSFFAEKDANTYIYRYGSDTVYQSLSEDNKQKIRDKCDISKEEADTATKKAIAYVNQQESLGVSKEDIQNYINDNIRPYLISDDYITEGSYVKVVAYSLLSILGALLMAEIVRRIFYYIVLGSIKPKK